MSRENRPNTLWPIGTDVEMVDAYGRNPVRGKILAHYGPVDVLVEDTRQVRHYGQTWRIVSDPPSAESDDLFADLLG